MMRKHLTLAAAAAMAAGTMGWMGSSQWLWAEDQQHGQHGQTGQQQGQTGQQGQMGQQGQSGQMGAANLPPGIQQKGGQEDVSGIRDTIASATNAAYTKGGFDDLLERFTQADRDRLNQYLAQNQDKLNVLDGRIAQIQKAWQDKYNQEFDLEDNAEVVFGQDYRDFVIVQGEIVNPALLTVWPVTPTSEQSGQQQQQQHMQPQGGQSPQVRGDVQIGDRTISGQAGADNANVGRSEMGGQTGEAGQAGQTNQQQGQGATQLEKGKSVAIVTFPSQQNLPELNVSLIQGTANDWRIDVPDSLTGQQLYDQLLNHLTAFGEMHGQWPQDVNQAYRTASHHVLMACYNVNLPQTGGMQQQGGQQPQQSGQNR